MLALEERIRLLGATFLSSRDIRHFTCSDVQKIHSVNPRVSIDGILKVLLELLETEAYDPSKELLLTQNCPSDQGVFNSITVFLLNKTILFYLLALLIVLAISMVGEFLFRTYGSQVPHRSSDTASGDGQKAGGMEKAREGKLVWVAIMAHRIWGDIHSHLTGLQGTDGLVLLSFQLSLIAILIPSFLMVITVLLMRVFSTWNVIRTALCLWVVFILSAVAIYYHGSRNRIITGNRKTTRTLLISRISHDICTEEFLRSYFQDNNADIVTGISLIHKLMDEPSRSRPATSAFVTFKTSQHAEKARKYIINQRTLRGWAAEWAPPSSDIVWSNLHQKGSHTCLLKMIIQYFFGTLLPLAGSTIVVESLKLLVDKAQFFYVVLSYSKSILTIFFLVLVRICPVFQVDHMRKSSSHLGIFFSSLTIIVVSEIVLPMLNFKDIWNSIIWTRTDPNVLNHWIRLQCIFRPDLGSEMSMSVIEWNLFHSFFILPRIMQWINRLWLRLIKSPTAEDPSPLDAFDIGDRYSQLVAQFIITCVGYFTYPPIIPISVLCLVVGYVIDRYTMVHIYRPTYSDANIHRWAMLFVLLMLVIQSVLLFYKNVLMVEKELILVGDSAVITMFIGLHSLFCVVSILIQLLFTSSQTCNSTIPQDEEAQSYIPPPLRPHSGEQSSVPIRNTSKQPKPSKQDTKSGSITSIRAVCLTFLVPLIVTSVIVTTIRLTFVPKVAYSKTNNANETLNYNLSLYSGRVPYSIMHEVCQKDASWLTIESRCADILVDNAVRNNKSTPFKKMDEGRRLLWTGGFFNLTTSDHWQWLDKNVKTEYSNFCFVNQTAEIVARAKQMGVSMLYIVKDYTGNKFNKNGRACWQIFSHDELNANGFSFPADSNPRLTFACKSDSSQK